MPHQGINSAAAAAQNVWRTGVYTQPEPGQTEHTGPATRFYEVAKEYVDKNPDLKEIGSLSFSSLAEVGASILTGMPVAGVAGASATFEVASHTAGKNETYNQMQEGAAATINSFVGSNKPQEAGQEQEGESIGSEIAKAVGKWREASTQWQQTAGSRFFDQGQAV